MEPKGPIIIKENGKRLKIYPDYSLKKESETESAATLESPKDESIPEYVRYTNNRPGKNPHRSFKIFQPIIVAILSAIIIGSVLSFVMFQVFVSVEEDLANQSQIQQLPAAADSNTANETAAEKSLFSLEAIHSFVLQAGVFSEKANADQLAGELAKSDIPSFVWERDGQFFVFVGALANKAQGEKLAEKYSEVELYVKEWSTLPGEIELNDEEISWFTAFREQFINQLQSEDQNLTFSVESLPEINESEIVQSFKETVEKNDMSMPISLLKIMYAYEQIGMK